MSYILDALRRAEAERERGAVPGLHAQTAAGAPQAGDARRPMPPWIWLAAGGGIALAGVLAWTMLGGEPARPAPAAPAATAPAPAPIAPQASLPPSIERPVVAAPAPSSQVVAARPVAPAVASSEPVVQTLPPPRPPAASEAPPAPRTYALSELPDDVRRQLPAIGVGGAIHSPDPASRVLIINGQLFHEKDKIAPDLTLLQIHLKEAVLQFRDYRVKIGF